MTTSRTYLLTGASSGVGASIAEHLATAGHHIIGISRRRPAIDIEWIEADLATADGHATVATATAEHTIDAIIYCAGIWETDAFTDDYRFEAGDRNETLALMHANLIAPIEVIRSTLPALRRSHAPKVILMGAVSGLDNFPGREVVNTATKFGVRGAVHALRNELRPDRIAVTAINPGSIATAEVLAELAAHGGDEHDAIPLADLHRVIDCVLSLSNNSSIKEIDLPSMNETGA